MMCIWKCLQYDVYMEVFTVLCMQLVMYDVVCTVQHV